MKKILKLIVLIFLVITGIWFYKKHKEKVRIKKELEEKLAKEREDKLAKEREEIRKKLFDFFKTRLEDIKIATTMFSEYLDYNKGYFTYYQLITWNRQYNNLYNEIKGKTFEHIQLSIDNVKTIETFIDYIRNSIRLRDNFNQNFVANELKLYSNFFDNIEGRKLDIQQRTAIVTDENNNIVIAGAGSGKTTTIVGKVNYVIDRYHISPNEILLISFTKKSATTLANRIDIEGVEAKTFHKFGKDIIADCEGRQPSIFDEKQFKPLITKYFSELLKNENYLKKVTEYFTDFLKPEKSQFDFDNQGDYIQYIKDQNFRTYKLKEVSVNGRRTYKMEVVKSIEECKIANFLLFNGIEYEYESPYEFYTATENFSQYKPDFTIKQNGQRVYIEHFAIARNGNVPKFFAKNGETQDQAKKRYWDKISWARELHKTNKTALIETYSYEMSESILFKNLANHLKEIGITLNPKSPEEIWQIINNAAEDEVNSFITLFGTFITLMKSNNYSIIDVINKNKQTENAYFKQRNSLFIDIIKPIYERYENYLSERNEIDFSDMINKASKYITSKEYKRKYSYVIIDEFQDISIGRYQLIKAIKDSNPFCKLFAVGDDWQSIYRFSGSDIALFKDFEKYFGFTVKSKIETTYRFHTPLINLSSDFIQKNPNQTRKVLNGTSNTLSTYYKIQYSNSKNQDDTLAVQDIFKELLIKNKNIENKKIFILGRYSFDIDRLKNENGFLKIDKENETVLFGMKTKEGEIRKLKAQFMTVHKAKGLEADIIIILNCNSGKHGFPSEMSDDQVLNLLLSEADQFENGEERRLFYVAMTRAKEFVYFIADSSFKSKFIAELEVESGQSPNKKCPICKNADLVLKKEEIIKIGKWYKFYGCANYLYGCDYTKTEWIKF